MSIIYTVIISHKLVARSYIYTVHFMRVRVRPTTNIFKRELSIAVTVAQHANVPKLYLSRETFFPFTSTDDSGYPSFTSCRTGKAVCAVIPMADAYEILTSQRHLRCAAVLADRLQENYRTIIMINDHCPAVSFSECFVLFAQLRDERFVSFIVTASKLGGRDARMEGGWKVLYCNARHRFAISGSK